MAVLEPFRGNYYLWKYLPSVPAAVIFCIIFLTTTLAYVWKIWKTRAWFCIPMAIGGYSKLKNPPKAAMACKAGSVLC